MKIKRNLDADRCLVKKAFVTRLTVLSGILSLASFAQEPNKPCPAFSPDQVAVLLQMMGGAQRHPAPAISPQMLQSFLQALQQMQNTGMPPSGNANYIPIPGPSGVQTAQAPAAGSSTPQLAASMRQAGG